MRRSALVLALCGCNQFYGLDATKARDAAPDAHDRQVRLSMLVGPTTDSANEGTPVLRPVSPAPKPRIALLDKPLEAARYVEDDPSGIVPYPIEFLGKPWRLEYAPPDGIANEVQWSPADTAGHLIVPVVGRTERTTVPANTGYILSMKLLSGTLYSFTPQTVIYTTGYWSRAASAITTLTPKVDFSIAPSMSGPAGSPSVSDQDVVVAVDYAIDGNCRVASRAGAARATALDPGALTSLELAVETGTEQIIPAFTGETPFDAQSRLKGLLGTRSDDQSGGKMIFGRLAQTLLPPFTTSIDDVPAPLLIPIAECPVLGAGPPTTVFHLGGGLAFPKGSFVFVTNDRIVNGVRLRSSIAAIGRAAGSTYESTFHVAGTRSIKLGGVDLAAADGASVDTRAELALEFETATNLVVDYFEVTLYRLAGTALEPVRTYVGPDPAKPTIRIDPSLVLPNAEYVFAVRTYRGRPGARLNDFQTVQGPQAVATIFSATFTR